MKKLLKENKKILIITALITLLPILFGLVYWHQLPDEMPTHFGPSGAADGWTGKAASVFLMPLGMLALHALCLVGYVLDKKNREQNPKAIRLVFWIAPAISLLVNGMMYAAVLGDGMQIMGALHLFLGLLLMVCGNFLPKCRQNATLGIKIKWTLANEENWNRTHRLAGKIWVAGGAAIMLCALLPEKMLWLPLAVFVLLILVPMLYSFLLYRRQKAAGVADQGKKIEYPKWVGKFSGAMIALILALVAVLMFTGSIQISFGESAFTVQSTYYQDITVAYDAVESLEYAETGVSGRRVWGYGSARLLLGTFSNEEDGAYTRYTYTGNGPCIRLTVNGELLVLGGENAAATEQLYQELLARVALPE